ncbi:cytosine transporter [uncultured delta proteobacterium]|uniref:Cytosine transporter n=1 Tax=uncultured delta proteobacterium TaxID=34034 RepID=A0A212JYS3_9DELT|nr:cytosine transporter [uncultured delta proteobacterium]
MDAAQAAHSHDDYAQTPVPERERRSFFSISMVMLGYTFFAASMWTGGALGTGLRLFPDLIVTILAGNVILGIYGGFLGYAASCTNLSTHMLARYAFGSFGSKLPSFMLAFTQIGWFGVGVAMLAYPLNKLMGLPVMPIILVSGILMTLTVVVGFKAIEWISWIAVPAIFILGFWSMGTAIAENGGAAALAAIEPKNPMTFAVGVALGVGSFISGATLTPDFVRFAKNRKDGVSATVVGFTFGNSLMFFFGAIGAMAVGVADTAEVLAAQGLLGGGIALLALNIWTTNDNALYASGLGLANITGWKRKTVTIIAGLIGTIFADFLYNNFVGWLTFLSVSLPPIGGIIIADFFIRRGRSITASEKPEFLRPAALVAWAAAIAVSKISPAEGFFCVAPLNSILTAVIVYLLADKLLPKRSA